MPPTPISPLSLEGPVAIFQSDGLWHLTVNASEADAADAVRAIAEMGIADRSFVSYLPRTIFFLADPVHTPQPEGP